MTLPAAGTVRGVNDLEEGDILTPRKWLAVLGLVFFGASMGVAQPPEREKWTAYETDHFQFFSNAPRGRVRELVESFGKLHSFITRGGREGLETTPATVFVFKSQRSMEPYLREPPQTRTIHTSWEAFHDGDRLWLSLNADIGDDVRPLAYSAYVGNYFGVRYPGLPFWARHGLADFYAGFRDKKGSEVAVGLPRTELVVTLRRSSWMPWRQFFQIGRSSATLDQGRTLGLFNAQAWVAVHFLMTGGPKPELGSKAFAPLRQGHTEEAVLRDLYGWTLEEFDNEIKNYIQRPGLPYFPVEVEELEVPEIRERQLGRSELLLLLGEHLVTTHRPPPIEFTRAHVGPLLEDREVGAQATVIAARLAMASGDHASAREMFEHAVALPNAGGREWLQYANFLAQAGASSDETLEALDRALDLGVDKAAGAGLLAQALNSVPSTQDELDTYRQAVESGGVRAPNVIYNLALGQIRMERFDEAREAIESWLRPLDAQSADELLTLVLQNETVARVNAAHAAGDLQAALDAYSEAIEKAEGTMKESFVASKQNLERQLRDQRQWEAMSEAVDLYNSQRYTEAREKLEALVEEGVVDARLKAEVEGLLGRLR